MDVRGEVSWNATAYGALKSKSVSKGLGNLSVVRQVIFQLLAQEFLAPAIYVGWPFRHIPQKYTKGFPRSASSCADS